MNSIPEDKDYKDFLNPESLTVAKGYAEPALLDDGWSFRMSVAIISSARRL